MPTYNDPIGKGEAAFVSLVSALTLTGTRGGEEVALEVHPGRETGQKEAPHVACIIDGGGDELVKGTGIFRHSGHIDVATLFDENTETEHGVLAKTVADALITDSIAADLSSAVADYHVYDVTFGSPQSENSGHVITRLPFQITHCCSDLT